MRRTLAKSSSGFGTLVQNQYVDAGTQTGPPCDPSSGALDRPPRDEPYPDWAKDIWERLNGRDQSQEERDYSRNWFESRHQNFSSLVHWR